LGASNGGGLAALLSIRQLAVVWLWLRLVVAMVVVAVVVVAMVVARDKA
jgi:hypothetical protein